MYINNQRQFTSTDNNLFQELILLDTLVNSTIVFYI